MLSAVCIINYVYDAVCTFGKVLDKCLRGLFKVCVFSLHHSINRLLMETRRVLRNNPHLGLPFFRRLTNDRIN